MEESMDMDDMLNLWEAELEDDAARLDVTPSSRPLPIRESITSIHRLTPSHSALFKTMFFYLAVI